MSQLVDFWFRKKKFITRKYDMKFLLIRSAMAKIDIK